MRLALAAEWKLWVASIVSSVKPERFQPKFRILLHLGYSFLKRSKGSSTRGRDDNRTLSMQAIPRFLQFLSWAGMGLLLAGCCCERRVVLVVPPPAPYSRVVTSDFEGRPIAEYIAEGPVCETECGFRFRAVERRIFRPCVLEFRYPLGRPVTVAAPNLVATPSCKPCWLVALDARPVQDCGPAPSIIDKTTYY